ncbi:MAG: hypothetical protein ACTIJJ_01860 [Galactobacter sp.]|uniref:hypothetical protein n=1 Tax=Galactobacter sp. TaxID=2676125 RepID=UPI0025C723EE|nr:hypothetical protein [Galactobacter sp.]
MSNFATARRVRTAAIIAAPLTVLALGLSACAPKHITTMDSPTPKASDTAHASAAAEEHAEESEETGETSGSETLAPEPSEAAAPTDAASFLKAEDATYEVTSFTLDGAKVDPGTFTGVSVSGDATSDDGALVTTIGLCAGTVYTVTTSGSGYTFDEAGSSNLDKCADDDAATVAQSLDDALSGDVDVTVNGNKVTLAGAQGELVLTVAR